MSSSSPRHVMAMNNITCTTRVLLGLSLELLLSECKTGTLTSKLHPRVVIYMGLSLELLLSECKTGTLTSKLHPRVVIYVISCLVMFDQKFLYHVLPCLCTHFNKILNESLRVNKLFGYIKSK